MQLYAFDLLGNVAGVGLWSIYVYDKNIDIKSAYDTYLE